MLTARGRIRYVHIGDYRKWVNSELLSDLTGATLQCPGFPGVSMSCVELLPLKQGNFSCSTVSIANITDGSCVFTSCTNGGLVAPLPRVPDLEAQRTAMKRLSFLVGEWVGNARVRRGPSETAELLQTEEAQYKLDGLLLMIEGVGRAQSDGRPILQALGLISYDDETKTYHMRAFNDGRFLETEVKVSEDGQGMTWGFALGEIRTQSVMRINDRGEWTELHEITIGLQPPKQLMELAVHRQK